MREIIRILSAKNQHPNHWLRLFSAPEYAPGDNSDILSPITSDPLTATIHWKLAHTGLAGALTQETCRV
ncbi:hypothetical protein [Pantoea septica]|uniref:Uncharacterized protein n=1 Tax=Pantoea septica TaxID=472695 RepID=A0ABX3UNS7_9GAMM|nr:hypothetical protein HA46_16135 [Pantoea septica]